MRSRTLGRKGNQFESGWRKGSRAAVIGIGLTAVLSAKERLGAGTRHGSAVPAPHQELGMEFSGPPSPLDGQRVRQPYWRSRDGEERESLHGLRSETECVGQDEEAGLLRSIDR